MSLANGEVKTAIKSSNTLRAIWQVERNTN